MASYTKQVSVIDSFTVGTYPSANYRDNPKPIWMSNNPSNFFLPPARGNKLFISAMDEPGWYGRGNANAAYFILDESLIKGKKITKIDLHFYVSKSFHHEIQVVSWRIGTLYPTVGWNVISATSLNYSDYSMGIVSSDKDSAYNWIEINSNRESTNRPYAIVTYEDVAPKKPIELFPNNTNFDARMPIKFSWKYVSTDSQIQSAYEVQYSINDGVSWTTVSGSNGNQFHQFPASVFPTTATVKWRVRTKDANNLWSEWSDISKFDTLIATQRAPRIISPTSGYLNGSDKIKLSWEFLGGTDYDTQSKYELQYSTNGVSWNTITKTTDVQYHEFEKDFFGSGRVEWKVKTFNIFGDASEFSDTVAFNVISSPPIPQIQTITNSSRPKISWISVEQQYYEIRIYDNSNKLIYEIKEPSINKFHDVKIFLNDGNYRAELVIFNQYNLYSETATKDFTISTVKPPNPIIEVYSGEHSNTIRGNSNTQYTRVYRDNIFIGTLENNIFIDFTCENRKEYKYHLRAIDDEGNFSDSDIKVGICNFRNNTISTAKSPGDFIKLKYGLNSIPSKNTRKAISGSNFYFDGREYPVVEFSEFKSTEKSLKFFTRDKSDIDKLEELINKKEVLLYRDVEGENIYGTVLSVDDDKEMLGYNFGFTINKTDYSGDLDD